MAKKKKVVEAAADEGAVNPDVDQAAVSFEQALGELEQIVAALENGRLGLSESLESYEKGVHHLRRCYDLLEKAEKKIGLLSGTDAQGRPVVVPLEDVDSEASLEEKAQSRSRRRTAAGGSATRQGSSRGNKPPSGRVDEAGGLF